MCASAIGVLRAAVSAGIDHIDTAQYYGPDMVNDLIREALYPLSAGAGDREQGRGLPRRRRRRTSAARGLRGTAVGAIGHETRIAITGSFK
jgi:hypothetical protein